MSRTRSEKTSRKLATGAVSLPIPGAAYYDLPITPHRLMQAPIPKTGSGLDTIQRFVAANQALPIRELVNAPMDARK